MEQVIKNIVDDMAPFMSLTTQVELQRVLIRRLPELQHQKQDTVEYDYMQIFLDAKKMEGMSKHTIRNYRLSIAKLEEYYEGKSYRATTEDISTTMHYALVNRENVKAAHKRYLS